MTNQAFSKGDKILIGINTFEVVVTTNEHCGVMAEDNADTVFMYAWDRIKELGQKIVTVDTPLFAIEEVLVGIDILPASRTRDTGFVVGEKVKSIFGMFEGKVVAIEEKTGRIICVSDRVNANDDRQRWAYKPSELRRKSQQGYTTFEVGGKYKIHANEPGVKSVDVIGTKTHYADEVRLVNLADGLTYGTVNKKSSKAALALAGIARVDILK